MEFYIWNEGGTADEVCEALMQAATRGVTCRSHFDELLEASVRIFGFKSGLLHTKSAVVDRETSLFGTVNLDIRSFWLDVEVTLCVYDSQFAECLLALLQKYMEDSVRVDLDAWRGRPTTERFSENLGRLCSSLL